MTFIKNFALYLLVPFSIIASLSSCAVEETPITIEKEDGQTVTFRAGCADDFFAITAAPNSEIIHMEVPGYVQLGSSPLSVTPPDSDAITLNDLKGIALFLGDYYVTTGPNNQPPYDNALLMIDPFSSVVLQHVMNLGMTVSDICFVDKDFGAFFGLVGLDDNSNSLAWIPYAGNTGPTTFLTPVIVPINGINPGHTASGLTWTYPTSGMHPCPQDFSLFVTSSSPTSNKAIVWEVHPITGTVLGNVSTIIGTEYQGQHVANGWVHCIEEIQVGHADMQAGGFTFSAEPFGCSQTKLPPWPNYMGVNQNIPYEDFCTIPYAQ